MRRRLWSQFLSAGLATAFILAVTTKEAHAYIDIGSGSMMIQIILATLFGSLFTIKVFWKRLTGFASRMVAKVKHPREASK